MGEFGEDKPPIPGEGQPFFADVPYKEEIIYEKRLTFEAASKCLNTLGKDECGARYAYLRLTATSMKLTDISIVLHFKHVLFLDVSHNYLTTSALQVATALPFLILLKAERNRIESADLDPMPYLQVLCLNENQINSTSDINQPLLDCLELNYNNIYETNFDTCRLDNLKQLELRSNLLFQLGGSYPPTIEKLYAAANKINNINEMDVAQLTSLELLHMRDNLLENLDGFSGELVSLKYLNLRSNRIKRMREFLKLRSLPALETLIVLGNPLIGFEPVEKGEGGGGGAGGEPGEGGEDDTDPLVIALLAVLPHLKRINKVVITTMHRIKAEDIDNAVLDAIFYTNEPDESEVEATSRTPTTTDLTSDYNKTESEGERPPNEEQQP